MRAVQLSAIDSRHRQLTSSQARRNAFSGRHACALLPRQSFSERGRHPGSLEVDLGRIPNEGVQPGATEARPRLQVKSFSSFTQPTIGASHRHHRQARLRPKAGDKSTELLREEQDKMLGVSKFGAHPRGVSIKVDASTGAAGRALQGAAAGAVLGFGAGLIGSGIALAAGASLGGAALGLMLGGAALGALVGGLVGGFSEEFRYTQTIDTNVPLGGSTSPYVDPRPNDDNKPFYWTDAEHRRHGTRFIDHPSRSVPSSGTTRWDATLSIAHIANKTVSIMESLRYGFSLDSSGSVTTRAPVSTSSVGTHIGTLSSSFSDWTFKKG